METLSEWQKQHDAENLLKLPIEWEIWKDFVLSKKGTMKKFYSAIKHGHSGHDAAHLAISCVRMGGKTAEGMTVYGWSGEMPEGGDYEILGKRS